MVIIYKNIVAAKLEREREWQTINSRATQHTPRVDGAEPRATNNSTGPRRY